ncbi:MAG: branched-chain amino acid ABC transporter permease, partial [Pseudomonadota bacterium]
AAERQVAGIDLTQRGPRFAVALGIFALGLLAKLWLIQSAPGRALVAIRENAPRAEMLGYNVFRLRLLAIGLSGVYAGAAGALYGLLFGYVGATFASVQYSIFALLYVLLGGAGTLLGPLLGTSLMFLLVDTASGLTDAYLLLVGVALVLLTLFAPLGLLGELRRRVLRWLP